VQRGWIAGPSLTLRAFAALAGPLDLLVRHRLGAGGPLLTQPGSPTFSLPVQRGWIAGPSLTPRAFAGQTHPRV